MRSRFYSLKMNLRQEKNEECFGPSSVPAAFARSQHTFSPQHPPPPPPLLSVLTQLNISKNSHKLGSPFTSSRKWSGNLARPEHKFSQVPQHMIARRLGNLTIKRPDLLNIESTVIVLTKTFPPKKFKANNIEHVVGSHLRTASCSTSSRWSWTWSPWSTRPSSAR